MSLSTVDFCKVYIPLARAGKSAKEIASALNLGEDVKASQKVSQKATIIRKSLKEAAEKQAKVDGLDADATIALIESTVAKIPKLKTRTRITNDLLGMLDDIIAQCDEPDETENTPE